MSDNTHSTPASFSGAVAEISQNAATFAKIVGRKRTFIKFVRMIKFLIHPSTVPRWEALLGGTTKSKGLDSNAAACCRDGSLKSDTEPSRKGLWWNSEAELQR